MDKPLRRALVLAALYWVLGSIWILGSDLILVRLTSGVDGFSGPQTWKGLAFVTATAALFFAVLYRELSRSLEARRAAEFQARILDEVSDAVIATDARGGLLLLNRAAEEIFGWSSDEMGARDVVALLPPALRAQLEGTEPELRAGGRWRGEFLAAKRDGSTIPVYAVTSPIQEPDGTVRGILAVATDISAEKAAERALEEGEARYRALIEGSSDITTILDADGGVRYVSPAYERILGRPTASGPDVGLGDALVVHPDDHDAVDAAIREVAASPGRVVNFEARLRHANGQWVSMEHRARNHVDHPALRGIVVHSRDVSVHRRLEQQLRQAQKMEAVGRLAGGIAHDFNNIVTGIMGHAQLLLTDLEDDPTARSDIQEIYAAAQRAGGLTRQLLAFSRQQILRPEILSLNEVVTSLRGMLQRLVEESIEVRADLDEDLNRVRIDRVQLEQVIMNLVVNAKDAVRDNGIVTIRTRNTVLSESDARRFPFQMPAGPYVTLAVEDDGEGIPKEIRDRIFDPFFTTKEVGKGTGLGLSTVYGIIKQSGGFIWVDSKIGVGSTFTVYLPQAEGQTRTKSAPEVGEVRHGSETILVVEDDEAIRRIIVRTLERWGYEVLGAKDGVEGLEMIRSERSVDLVIADLVMPRMGGREMVRAATSEGWKGNVLFVSGYAADRDTRDSLGGAGELLQKPFAPRDLALRIRALLDRPPG